jgi:threonine dehydrogenase-like Zn-dependent dehydrogenase
VRALVYRSAGDVRLEVRPEPVAGAGEVVVRPLLTGLCGTDRAIVAGRYAARPGTVLGHESIGVVAGVGAGVAAFSAGDRVAINPTGFCGACAACRAGRTGRCAEKAVREVGISVDGALSEAVAVPAGLVAALDPALPDRRAVFAEPLACALNGLRAAALDASDRVLVLGGGPLGLLLALAAARTAESVRVAERDPYRRALGERVLGPPGEDDEPPTLVADTTGNGLGTAIAAVADGGRVLLMGCDDRATATVRPFELTARGIAVVGACDYDEAMFGAALDALRELECERLLTHVLPLERYEEALDLLGVATSGAAAPGGASRYRAMKVALAPAA